MSIVLKYFFICHKLIGIGKLSPRSIALSFAKIHPFQNIYLLSI